MRTRPAAGRAGRWVIGLAVLVVGSLGLAGCTSSSSASPSTTSSAAGASSSQPPLGYRSPPSFLPSTAQPVDQVVTASAGHPQLAEQGVGVQVVIPGGQVLATISGPKVPPFVTPPPPAVTATFDVSLADVSGTIPIALSDFTITDQLGRTFHPTWVQSATPPPSTISAGPAVTFEVTAVMPTGEGRIYWTPTPGSPEVGWDFIVEND